MNEELYAEFSVCPGCDIPKTMYVVKDKSGKVIEQLCGSCLRKKYLVGFAVPVEGHPSRRAVRRKGEK